MARTYGVGCTSCGAVFEWYKYDEPYSECPCCKATVRGDSGWDEKRVTVFGVWSSNLDESEFHAKTMKEKGIVTHGNECVLCAPKFRKLLEG